MQNAEVHLTWPAQPVKTCSWLPKMRVQPKNAKLIQIVFFTLIFPVKIGEKHVADLKSPHFWSQPNPNKLKLQKALSKISQIFCWDQLIFWVCAAILTASLALTNVLVNAATSTRHRDNWSCTRRRRCLLVSMWPAVAKAKVRLSLLVNFYCKTPTFDNTKGCTSWNHNPLSKAVSKAGLRPPLQKLQTVSPLCTSARCPPKASVQTLMDSKTPHHLGLVNINLQCLTIPTGAGFSPSIVVKIRSLRHDLRVMTPARLNEQTDRLSQDKNGANGHSSSHSAGYHFVPNRFWSCIVTGFALQWSVFKKIVPIYWSDNSLYKPFAFFAEGDWNPHHSAPGTAWLVPLAPLLLLHLLISEFQIENPPLSFPRNIRKVLLLIYKTQENPKRSFEEDTLPVAFTENCLPVYTLYVEQIHATMEFK